MFPFDETQVESIEMNARSLAGRTHSTSTLHFACIDNWASEIIEEKQLELVEYVRHHPNQAFFIFCSHPPLLTLGRGLQKLRNPNLPPLTEFDPTTVIEMPYPLYHLKRGGGLTFHYPGQIVLYPIISLTHFNIKIFDFMLELLALTKKSLLSEFEQKLLEVKFKIDRDYLGLWYQDDLGEYKKIASIGLAASRFITYHGLALNLEDDKEFFLKLQNLYPCGLKGDNYISVERLLNSSIELNKRNAIIKNMKAALIKKFHITI